MAGACAIVIIGTLLARMRWLNFLRYCGEHSIVIYLAFFLPMATTRTLLLREGWIHDIGTISLIVTIVGVVGALALWRMALAAGANFLFERPAAFWIAPKKAGRDAAGGGVDCYAPTTTVVASPNSSGIPDHPPDAGRRRAHLARPGGG